MIAGVVAGSSALVDKVRVKANHLGGSLDPHSCFLLQRGLKTLGLRLERHCANALALATALEAHPQARARPRHVKPAGGEPARPAAPVAAVRGAQAPAGAADSRALESAAAAARGCFSFLFLAPPAAAMGCSRALF